MPAGLELLDVPSRARSSSSVTGDQEGVGRGGRASASDQETPKALRRSIGRTPLDPARTRARAFARFRVRRTAQIDVWSLSDHRQHHPVQSRISHPPNVDAPGWHASTPSIGVARRCPRGISGLRPARRSSTRPYPPLSDRGILNSRAGGLDFLTGRPDGWVHVPTDQPSAGTAARRHEAALLRDGSCPVLLWAARASCEMPPKSRRDGRGVGRRPQVQQVMYAAATRDERAHSRSATTSVARAVASPWRSPERQRSPEQRRSPVRQRSPVRRRSPVQQRSPVRQRSPVWQRSPAQQRSPMQQHVPVRQYSPVRRVVWEPQRAVRAAASERPGQQSLSPTTSPKWHHPRDAQQRGRGSGSALPSWKTTSNVEWEQTCADARHAGIKIPTGVPETAANLRRLKREIQLLSIRGELDELNRSDWDAEDCYDVDEVQVAMDVRGLSNPERVSLWCVSIFMLSSRQLDSSVV